MQIKDTINEQIIKERNAKIKRSGNRFLIGFFIIFIAGYFLFFTSSIWLPASYENIHVTEIGSVVTGNDRKVTLLSWTYDKDRQEQEVVLEISNSSTDGIDKYLWSAVDIKQGFCDVEVVVEEKDFVVLHLSSVHPRWTEISLRMDTRADASSDATFNTLKVYTSKKAVQQVDEIKTLTAVEYRLQAADSKIAMYNHDIEKLADEIIGYEELMDNADKKIQELSDKEEFQTDLEKAETLEQITQLQSQKSELLSKKDSAGEKVKELQEKIKMQKKIKENISGGSR